MTARLVLAFMALFASSASLAGPVLTVCIRDTDEDPMQIRTLFEKIDREALSELPAAGLFFHDTNGFVPTDEFVRDINCHHGREDAGPMQVTAFRRLELPHTSENNPAYVVGTLRSAWFDRGPTSSSYSDLQNIWLVSFMQCDIQTVREVPELSYLLRGEGN